jgi:UPF0271 protein
LANIACGGHAGDDSSMRRALELCRAHGVHAGAHPSFPDRPGFGRRALTMHPDDLRTSVAEQCARLSAIARDRGERVGFVKPHGALYHSADRDPGYANAVVAGARDALEGPLTLVGPAGGELSTAARRAGMAYAREGFADRGVLPNGSLVPRDQPGALLLDPAQAAEQARRLALGGEVDTICVHGDSPGAPALVRAVREALDALPRE